MATEKRRIVALDFGTKCGWCYCDPGGPRAGTENLRYARDSKGMFLIRFEQFLNRLHGLGVDLVVFEDVVFSKFPKATQTWGAMFYFLAKWCEENGVEHCGVSVSEIKRWATGKGNAAKPAMVAACNERYGLALGPKDDNEADARLLLGCYTDGN